MENPHSAFNIHNKRIVRRCAEDQFIQSTIRRGLETATHNLWKYIRFASSFGSRLFMNASISSNPLWTDIQSVSTFSAHIRYLWILMNPIFPSIHSIRYDIQWPNPVEICMVGGHWVFLSLGANNMEKNRKSKQKLDGESHLSLSNYICMWNMWIRQNAFEVFASHFARLQRFTKMWNCMNEYFWIALYLDLFGFVRVTRLCNTSP